MIAKGSIVRLNEVALASNGWGPVYHDRDGRVETEPSRGNATVRWVGRKTTERVPVRFLRLAS